MTPIQRVAIRRAIGAVLIETQHQGLISDFVDKLEDKLSSTLENMKAKQLFPANYSTKVTVIPSDEFLQILDRASEREELEELLSDEPGPGIYEDPSTGYTANFSESFLSEETPTSPFSGEDLEYKYGEDFDAFWDVEDVMNFQIEFEQPELDELLNSIRDEMEGVFEIVGGSVTAAMESNKLFNDILSSMEAQYKKPMSVADIWEKVIETAKTHPHAATHFQLRCWVLALAKEYGLIDDFGFDLETDNGNVIAELYSIDTEEVQNFRPVETEVAPEKLSVDSVALGQSMAEIVIRKLNKEGYVDDIAKNKFLAELQKLSKKNEELAQRITDYHYSEPNALEKMKPFLKSLKALI